MRHFRGIAGVALIGVGAVSAPAHSQFVLEAKQGTSWTDKLSVSDGATLNFRWKWEGRGDISGAIWQMTYTAPGSTRGDLPIAKFGSVPISSSRLSDYSFFNILPDQVPDNAPSTFYVRLRSGESYSSWIPVTVAATRAVTTIAPPPSLPPPPPPPLVTSGVNNTDALWIKLTKIICRATSNDGSPSDEVYAVAAAVALNHEKPWESTVWTAFSPVYEGMNPSDVRSTSLTLWGPPDGGPVVLKNPQDAMIFFFLREHDSGNITLAKPIIYGALAAKVKTFTPALSYSQMVFNLDGMLHKLIVDATSSDDWISNAVDHSFKLTQQEIDDARAGRIVKKELTLGNDWMGVYTVRFQIGRMGTSPEAW